MGEDVKKLELIPWESSDAKRQKRYLQEFRSDKTRRDAKEIDSKLPEHNGTGSPVTKSPAGVSGGSNEAIGTQNPKQRDGDRTREHEGSTLPVDVLDLKKRQYSFMVSIMLLV